MPLTSDILYVIFEHTNAKVTKLSYNYNESQVCLDINPLKEFLGLPYLSGNMKSVLTDANARLILQKWCLFVLSAIRFDNAANEKMVDFLKVTYSFKILIKKLMKWHSIQMIK